MISVKKVKKRYRYSSILLRELVRTDFKLRYQNSILGYLWSLLKPLFIFIVLYIIFVKFLNIGGDIENWPVALFLGIVMWEFFNEVTKQGLKSVVSKGTIIRKINFPKYVIVTSSSVSAFINLLMNLVVVAVFVIAMGTPISLGYLMIPLYIAELYIFGLGLAFILGTLFVKIRDIDFIWEVLMRGGFYAAAVMFPISRVYDSSHLAGDLLLMNPVTQTIQDARHYLIGLPLSSYYLGSTVLMLVPIILSIVVLIYGALYFRKKSASFAENV